MLKKLGSFVYEHLDFKFYGVSWIALAVCLSIIPMLMYMPQHWGYENGLLEDIQMVVLFFIVYLCFTSKVNKSFFKFLILVMSIIIIREVNCGRTIFFPIPGTYHQYYSWRMLPWPWLGKVVHLIYASWIAIVTVIFFKKDFHKTVLDMVKNIKLPVWNLAFAGFAMFMGAIAEKATNNNFIFEEGFELLFYVSLGGIIWLYSRNKNFMLEKND